MQKISDSWRKMADEEFLTILHQPLYRIALFSSFSVDIIIYSLCGTKLFALEGKKKFMSCVHQNVLGPDNKF